MSITVNHLSFSYGKRPILRDMNLHVPDGELVCMLGPNGVGKSTLFRCILGLEDSYEGTITINGKDLRSLSIKERAREIAYIPQSHTSVYDYEVIDVVLMSTTASLQGLATPSAAQVAQAMRALERVDIEALAHRAYTEISGGEQQLVLVARALAQQARTIVMDEPTSALDFGNTVRVLLCIKSLAQSGYSIIQSTHQPEQAYLYSDRIVVVKDGRIACQGLPQEVMTKETIHSLYGVDVEVASLFGDAARVCVPSQAIESTETDRKEENGHGQN